MHRAAAVLLLVLPIPALSQDGSEPSKPDVTIRELATLLAETLDTKPFQKEQTLKEALEKLQTIYRDKDKELPIQINRNAFKEENPDAADLDDTPVKLPAFPRRMSGSQLLRALLAQAPTNNAAYLLNLGHVMITTEENASLPNLLGRLIEVSFTRRPLELALKDLYDQTGVAVILDARAGNRAKTPVTAKFTGEVTLGSALVLVSELAGLKLVIANEAILITTPAIADQIMREMKDNPYGLPPWNDYRNRPGSAPPPKRVEGAQFDNAWGQFAAELPRSPGERTQGPTSQGLAPGKFGGGQFGAIGGGQFGTRYGL